jgi:single-stranded DNA-binding protein
MSVLKGAFEGRIGQIYELTGEGKSQYVKLSIAVNKWVGEGKGETYNDKVTAYKTDWYNGVAFGGQAQFIVNNFSKGDIIVVTSAELDLSTYIKKDSADKIIDEKAISVRVILRDISGPYVKAKKDTSVNSSNNEKKATTSSIDDFDIPF